MSFLFLERNLITVPPSDVGVEMGFMLGTEQFGCQSLNIFVTGVFDFPFNSEWLDGNECFSGSVPSTQTRKSRAKSN